ncbi:MAG: hypothetical protein K0B37_11440 [Bacteroidales bacterium]|nr:hypothetical protein [Bacteroidales bacterium]
MKSKLLLPNYMKRIGWMILIPSVIIGILVLFEIVNFGFLDMKVFALYSSMILEDDIIVGIYKNNIADEILLISCILGGIIVAFSKEKQEDEFIAKIRLESLVWAIYINYAVLIFCTLFFYGFGFLYVMIFNMLTILLFFIIRFYFVVYKSKKSLSHEK